MAPILSVSVRVVAMRSLCQGPPNAVQDVPAERVMHGQLWMIEIVCRVALHPEFLHDATGAQIGGDGK
ncbi:MAG: hypothetical protein JO061_18400 [Acidobacteriaceae bacterium]|nr:hypothetical protein [Acidobacteriaceae bacterium]